MTVSMFVRHEVQDYATWKKGYDEAAQFIRGNGVIAESVHRDLENPNRLTICHQFADERAAQAFLALVDSDLFKKDAEKNSVNLKTMEVWIGEDI